MQTGVRNVGLELDATRAQDRRASIGRQPNSGIEQRCLADARIAEDEQRFAVHPGSLDEIAKQPEFTVAPQQPLTRTHANVHRSSPH
jgi:hypothetical protein